MRWLRRAGVALLVAVCVAGVILFQADRPAVGTPNPRVFIPSPGFYKNFSESDRATVADVYWLYLIQYYGEHVKSDHRLDSMPAMVDLITSLSPHWTEPYFLGAFAMLDLDPARPDIAYSLLEKGSQANPGDWHFPFYLGFFAYTFGGKDGRRLAADWYAKAASLPGRPAYVPALAADLLGTGSDKRKAIDLWAQVYGLGDTYMQQKAVTALDRLLPKDKLGREKAVAPLQSFMPADRWTPFLTDLFRGYL